MKAVSGYQRILRRIDMKARTTRTLTMTTIQTRRPKRVSEVEVGSDLSLAEPPPERP